MRTTNKIAKTAVSALVTFAAFTGTASAHNINKSAADAKCRDYVQRVVDNTAFTRADISSYRAFPGHNHYVRCTAKYDTAQTQASKRYACQETLDVYVLPEKSDRGGLIFMSHITKPCGPTKLVGPRPG